MILAYLYDEQLCVAKQHLAVCKHMEVAFSILHSCSLNPDSVSMIKGSSMSSYQDQGVYWEWFEDQKLSSFTAKWAIAKTTS